MLYSTIFAGLLVAASAVSWKDTTVSDWDAIDHRAVFQQWAEDFEMTYDSVADEAKHFVTWMDNWKNIIKENNKQDSYVLALNQFGDMTSEEFSLYIHGGSGNSCLQSNDDKNTAVLTTFIDKSKQEKKSVGGKVSSNPGSVDWTEEGVVTPVKDQGSCGSCWAFSTTGSIECNWAIQEGTLNSLSEQQLVDCSDSYGNEGCDGGLMDQAFQYVIGEGGLCNEDEYPYTGEDGECQSSECGTQYDPVTAYTDVTPDVWVDLETAVASGCVSVAVQANQFAFQYYSGGVLDGRCGTRLDHGVLVVGYGNDTDAGLQYWKVKNSWGSSWGEDGYLRICKDCDKNKDKGECGILEDPSYPSP